MRNEFNLSDNIIELWYPHIDVKKVKEFIKILEDNSFIEATGSIKVVSLDFIKKKAGDLELK